MRREAKRRRNIIIALSLVLFLMSAGYAAFYTQLQVGNTTSINTNWDVEIVDVAIAKEEGNNKITGNAENVSFSYNNTDGLTASMEANVYEKGDSIEYDVTIKNKGDLDARIDEITSNTKSTSDAVKVSFSGYAKGQRLPKNQEMVIKVKIEYNPDFNGEITKDETTEVEVNFNFTQGAGSTEGGTAPTTYLVTYDYATNGGTSATGENEYIVSGTEINLSSITATKQGYTFVGWNTNKDAQTGLSTVTMDDNTTLYAIFEKTINVTYQKGENITIIGTKSDTYNEIVHLYNNETSKEITLPTITSSLSGATLEWYKGETKVGVPGEKYAVKEDTTLIAKATVPPIIKSWSSSASTDFHNSTYSENITQVVFEDEINIPEGATSWDVSATANSKSVMAWVTTDPDDNTKYVLHIAGEGGVIANQDSSYIFYRFTNLKSITFGNNYDTSSVTNMASMFYGCSGLTSLDLSKFDTSNVTNMDSMFKDCRSLTSLDLGDKFDTSNVTGMYSMFDGCSSLTSLDVSKWDTSSVTNMSNMFYNCSNLTSLDVSNFKTSKVTIMSSMFYGCSGLTSLDLSKFDTSKVTNMSNMFAHCSNLTSLDVSKFDTSNVKDMYAMFFDCSNLTSLDVSKWDTSNVTDMGTMFNGCSSLTNLDVSNFKTSKVTNMYRMFNDCSSLTTLDVSKFDTSNVKDMYYMFQNCNNLTTIYASDKFDTSKVTSSTYMFGGDTKLVGGNGTTFNSSKTNKEYARIDKPGTPGYFTSLIELSTSSTSNTITVAANPNTSYFGTITKYEYSIDGGETWIDAGTNNAYQFTGLNPNTEYTVLVRITGSNGTKSASTTVKTAFTDAPTYTEDTGVVTITYPSGCGSTYTCTYQKDDGEEVTVTSTTANVEFEVSGNIVAKVSDGTNEVSSSYAYVSPCKTVKILGQDTTACMDNVKTKYVSNANGVQFNSVSSDTNGKGLYIRSGTENSANPIYYYRGAVTNNNVLFGGFCWKAVRTTETGGTKLIYNGTPTDGKCTNTTGTSTQIGTSKFNSGSGSPAYNGYMYGTVYSYSTTSMTTGQSLTSSQTMLSSTSLSTNYYYGDDITYDSATGKYSLTNPTKVSSTSDYPNLEGKYTFRNSSETYTYPSVYYIAKVNSSTMYYIQLYGGNLLNYYNNVVIGTGITDNGDNTYTLTGTKAIKKSDWYSDYASYKDYYTCNYSTSTCSSPRHITNTSKTNYTYVVAGDKITFGTSVDDNYTLQNTVTVSKDEWYNGEYSKYKDYYTCNTNSASCTKANIRRVTATTSTSYTYAPNYLFGKTVSYDNGTYTVNDTIENIDNYNNTDDIATHHYYCTTAGSNTCTSVRYLFYYTGSGYGYGITLTNGVTTVDEALERMQTNTTNSTIKTYIDNWYNSNLNSYTNKLEDTVWCNDRSMNTEGTDQQYINNGWKADGGSTKNYLYYSPYGRAYQTYSPSLSCPNKNDAFTVSDTTNGNGALTYPVALLTADEIMLAGGNSGTGNSSYYLYTNQYFLSLSPDYFGDYYAGEFGVYSAGTLGFYFVSDTHGVRPSVSLATGTEASSGDGSADSPYVVN